MIDLQSASMVPLVPIVQVPDDTVQVKPSITVVTEGEFLILSSMGPVTMGLFLTGRGDPVRGTLQWEMHPDSICETLAISLVPYHHLMDISQASAHLTYLLSCRTIPWRYIALKCSRS